MEDNNILLQESCMDGSYQLRLKLKYLQEDKEKLELSNNEMKQNINLLRQINKELAKTSSIIDGNPLVQKLQHQNRHLETSYIRIMSQNNALTCKNLMLEQIIQESQNQHIQILKGYENKIIQLRRSIQFKQSCIQSYEQSTNSNVNGYEVGNIPISNVSMVFFNEIDSYKATISLFQNKVKQLQTQLLSLNHKCVKIQQEKALIDVLISSRYGYAQFRQRLNKEPIKAFSQEKNHISIKKTSVLGKQKTKNDKKQKQQKSKQTIHSSQPQQTREISYQCTSGNFKLNQLKDQLKKANVDLTKLTINYRKQHKKRKQNDQKIRILLNSNKFYKEKRQCNTAQLNYFKKTTSDLLRLIQKRRIKRTYSVDKTQVQQLIASIKKPQEIQLIQNNNKYWRKVQQQINHRIEAKTKVDLETINRTRLKKSLSDILDFSQMCHDDDNIHKYYFSKNTLHSNKAIINQNKDFSSEKKNNIDDFSRILELGANGQIFDDQTLIIKAKPISYAERKKIKTKSKISDAHNLTIIRENIL